LGIGLYLRGLWKQSNSTLGIVDGVAPLKSISTARLFLARTYFYLGDPKECAKREARLYTEAQDRGDLNMTVNMRTSTHVRMWLAADDPERARREVREALAEWSQTGFFLQHWQAMIYEPDIDLYVGDGARAYERFWQDLPALRRSLLLRSVMIRATTLYARGRLAIATIESQPERRGSRIAEARRMVGKLRRESSPWAAMMAALVEAVADNAAGDKAATIASLRRAIELAKSTASMVYVPAASHRLGELLGGNEGRELVDEAVRTMTKWGVQNPARWVAVYMPGNWGHS
jgi:hypothetical protein